MSDPNPKKENKEEESLEKGEEKGGSALDSENKPSRLAQRKGQRPAFPFKRKPV